MVKDPKAFLVVAIFVLAIVMLKQHLWPRPMTTKSVTSHAEATLQGPKEAGAPAISARPDQIQKADSTLPPPIPQDISPDLNQFLNEHSAGDLLTTYHDQFLVYSQAIKDLGEVMPQCMHMADQTDAAWIERLKGTFSPTEIAALKPDLRRAIGVVYEAQLETCQGGVAKAALASENTLQATSKNLTTLITQFLAQRPAKDRERLQDFLNFQKPMLQEVGPIKTILGPEKRIDPASVAPRAGDFISNEPVFRQPFNLKAAIKQLDEASPSN